jgi:ferredoxin
MKKKTKKLKDIKALADAIACPVERSKVFVREFLAGPMCGRCLICSLGSEEMMRALERIMSGNGTDREISSIRWIAQSMTIGSLCKRGKETGAFVLATLASDGFEDHTRGHCPANTCSAFYEYRVLEEKCIYCGECKSVCKTNAIFGLKRKNEWETGNLPFSIRSKRCVKSGACEKVCPTGAIVRIEIKTGQTITA